MNTQNLQLTEKIKLMEEFKNTVLDYLDRQIEIEQEAQTAFQPTIVQDNDSELRRMREAEFIKSVEKIKELRKHRAVIAKMFPFSSADLEKNTHNVKRAKKQ